MRLPKWLLRSKKKWQSSDTIYRARRAVSPIAMGREKAKKLIIVVKRSKIDCKVSTLRCQTSTTWS